jgi:predicted nucleic acid-binding Zn ribbon protein
MPTYVYKFVDTGETIEVQQAFSDDALTEAVHPGNGRTMKVRKVFTPVGVTFKGGGFYKTDSRGKSTSGGKPSTSATGESGTSPASDSGSPASDSGSSGSKESPAPAPAAASTGSTASSGSSTG